MPDSAVVFYISGHGFGHASREVEIINALGRLRGPDVVLRSAVSPDLLARTLRVPYDLRPGVCDTGIVQSSSISHDDQATVDQALAFYASFDERIRLELEWLSDRKVRLVIGDIAPIAFEVAARLGVPGVAIANFTWDWIYETHPGFLPIGRGVIDTIQRAYRRATKAFQLPFAAGFEIFGEVVPLPLVARQPVHARSATRAHFGLPAAARVVLLSFGGYSLPTLDLGAIDCLPQWTVVTTDRVTGRSGLPDGIVRLDERAFLESTFRYEDLVAASDVVLTKPGYGIISECIATGTAMLYTSRGQFREYDLLVEHLPRYVRSRFIEPSELMAGRWLAPLDAIDEQGPAPEHMATNGAEVAAQLLAELIE